MTRITYYYARAVVVVALGASAFTSVPAVATPATGFTAVQQIKGEYPPLNVTADKTGKWDLKLHTKDSSDLWVVRNSIAGGGQSGWHTHPGPSLITVTIGEILAYEKRQPGVPTQALLGGPRLRRSRQRARPPDTECIADSCCGDGGSAVLARRSDPPHRHAAADKLKLPHVLDLRM
jgi:hypothetical protein